jgi:hypothetical protein
MSNKRETLKRIFDKLYDPKKYVILFDNDHDVKPAAREVGFRNPFDVTKIDKRSQFPEIMHQKGYSVLHLGGGNHAFVRADIFMPLQEPKEVEEWKLEPSVVSKISESESKAISDAYNNQIIKDFLFPKSGKIPFLHISRRFKTSFSFKVAGQTLTVKSMQAEADAIFETSDTIAVIEAKNSKKEILPEFNILQLYVPFKHLKTLQEEKRIPSEMNIRTVFLTRNEVKGKLFFDLHEFGFSDLEDFSSARLIRSKRYYLKH